MVTVDYDCRSTWAHRCPGTAVDATGAASPASLAHSMCHSVRQPASVEANFRQYVACSPVATNTQLLSATHR
jgi:hypothetical protein